MKVEQSTFQNETVILDSNEYKACEFRDCRLVYKGGDSPKMSQCHIANCQILFEDAAIRTLVFMRDLYHGTGPLGQQLVETIINNIRKPPTPGTTAS